MSESFFSFPLFKVQTLSTFENAFYGVFFFFSFFFFFWANVTFIIVDKVPAWILSLYDLFFFPRLNETYKTIVKFKQSHRCHIYIQHHLLGALKSDLSLSLRFGSGVGKYDLTAHCSAFWKRCFWATWRCLMSCFWSALFSGRCTGVGARWSERSGSSPTNSASHHGNCITSCSSNLFDLSTIYDGVWTELTKSRICVVPLQCSRPQWISSVAGSLGYLERLSGLLQQTGNQHSSCYMWPWGFQLSHDSSLSVSTWKSWICSSFPPSFSLHLCMDINWSGYFLSSSYDCRPARPADNVHTVQLPVAGCSIPEGKLCKMYGWGETKGTDTLLPSPFSNWHFLRVILRNIQIWKPLP